MHKVKFLSRGIFLVGMLHGLLLVQYKFWPQKLRPVFQIIALGFVTSQIYFISKLMGQLSIDMWNQIFDNLLEPIALICLFVVLVYGCALLVYSVIASKLMKSLVG